MLPSCCYCRCYCFSSRKKLDRKIICCSLTRQDAFEGFAELHVEDSVNDRVDEGVDVTQPCRQLEDHDSRCAIQLQLSTDGVHDIAREERHPANEEHTYNS